MKASISNPYFPSGNSRSPYDPKCIRPVSATTTFKSSAAIDNALRNSRRRIQTFRFSTLDRFAKTKPASKTEVNLPPNFLAKGSNPSKIRGADWSSYKTGRQDPSIWASRFDVAATFVETAIKEGLASTGVGEIPKRPSTASARFPTHTREKGFKDPQHFCYDFVVRGNADGPNYNLSKIQDPLKKPSSNFGASQAPRIIFGHDQRASHVSPGGDSPGPHNMPINIPDGADSKKFSPVNISLVNKPTSPKFSFAQEAYTPNFDGCGKFPKAKSGNPLFMSARFNYKAARSQARPRSARPRVPSRADPRAKE
eukprot:INCI2744.2.p1 GENE.INCI2744.2~~INCI2744.2.p1  ORF type:complete len:311 (+),score=34.57 INCI2744.2:142-1074(+)